MEDSQKDTGSVPDVCPAHWPFYSDNVTWPSTHGASSRNSLHRQFGDEAVVARHYDSAKKWVDYMLTFVKDGIIDRDQYGDWCVPPEDPKLIHSQDPLRQTSKPLLATSYLYYDLRLMERYAKLLGKDDDAARWAKLADEMKAAFNRKFYNAELGQYDNGSQTSCVLPLAFGLVPEDQRAARVRPPGAQDHRRDEQPHRHGAHRRAVSQSRADRRRPGRPGLHDRHAEGLPELGLHGLARAPPRSGSCGTATRPTPR